MIRILLNINVLSFIGYFLYKLVGNDYLIIDFDSKYFVLFAIAVGHVLNLSYFDLYKELKALRGKCG